MKDDTFKNPNPAPPLEFELTDNDTAKNMHLSEPIPLPLAKHSKQWKTNLNNLKKRSHLFNSPQMKAMNNQHIPRKRGLAENLKISIQD